MDSVKTYVSLMAVSGNMQQLNVKSVPYFIILLWASLTFNLESLASTGTSPRLNGLV